MQEESKVTRTFLSDDKKVTKTDNPIEIRLVRNVGNHWVQTFMPSIMICFTSTMSVFIPHDRPSARMGMCVTSLLSLISLFNGVRSDWIKTTAIRAIDIWTLLCYIGVVYALIEYCIVLHWSQEIQDPPDLKKVKPISKPQELKGNKALKIKSLEKASQIILPLYNLVFITLFFMICVIRQLL